MGSKGELSVLPEHGDIAVSLRKGGKNSERLIHVPSTECCSYGTWGFSNKIFAPFYLRWLLQKRFRSNLNGIRSNPSANNILIVVFLHVIATVVLLSKYY